MSTSVIEVQLKGDNRTLLRSFNEAGVAARNFSGIIGKAADVVKNRFSALEEAVKRTGHLFSGLGLGTSVSLLAATHSAGNFEASLRNVNTMLRLGRPQFRDLGNSLLSISQSLPLSANDLAKGLYDIVSAGYSGADGLKVLKASAEAAVGGLVDLKTAGDAVTSILNAYSFSADQASTASDILFKTAELGKTNFADLSAGMGEWTGLAAAAGVSAREAGAALATLTDNGYDAANASTALAAVTRAFLEPSDTMKQKVIDLGYSNASTMLKTLGLSGAVQALTGSVHRNASGVRSLFQDARALSGVLSLTSGNASTYNKNLQIINDRQATAGTTAKAAAENAKGLNAGLSQLKDTVLAASISIGSRLTGSFSFLINRMDWLVRGFQHIPGPIKTIVAWFGILGSTIVAVGGYFLASHAKAIVFGEVIDRLNSSKFLSGMGLQIPKITSLFGWLVKGVEVAIRTFARLFGVERELEQFAAVSKMIALTTLEAVGIIALAWYAFSSSAAKGTAEFKKWKAEAEKGNDTTTAKGIDAASAALRVHQVELDKTIKKHKGWLDSLASVLNPAPGNKRFLFQSLFDDAKNESALNKTNKQLKEYAQQSKTFNQQVGEIQKATGASAVSIIKMAQSMEIDLTSGSKKGVEAIKAGIVAMKYGQETAGGLADQLNNLAGAYDTLAASGLSMTSNQSAIASVLRSFTSITATAKDSSTIALDLASAELSVRQAVLGQSDALKKLNDLRNPADILKVRDAELALRSSYLDEKDAQRALGAAQRHAELVKKAGRSAEEVATATDEVSRAQLNVDEAQQKTKTSQDDLNTARHEGLQYQHDLLDAQLTYQGAVINTMKAEQDLEKQRKNTAVAGGASGPSAEDALTNLDKGADAAKVYSDEIKAIELRAGKDGPALARYLIGLGPDAASLVHAMANATQPEFERMAGIVQKAMRATGDAAVLALDVAMQALEAKGKLGAKATVDAIAVELGVLPETLKKIGATWWPALLTGISKSADDIAKFLQAQADKQGAPKDIAAPKPKNDRGVDFTFDQAQPPSDYPQPKAFGGFFARATNVTVGESGTEAIIAMSKHQGVGQLYATASAMGYRLLAKDSSYRPQSAQAAAQPIVVHVMAPQGGDTLVTVDKIVGVNFDDAIKQAKRAARKGAVARTGQGGWGQ